MLFQKKPVIVHAERFLASDRKDLKDLLKYCAKLKVKIDLNGNNLKFSLNDLPVFDGSWIVKDGTKFSVYSDTDFKNSFTACESSDEVFEDATSREDGLNEKDLDEVLPTV